MKRRAPGLALATAIGLIALSLLGATAAAGAPAGSTAPAAPTGSAGSVGTLTQQYPLGNQTLCCKSGSSTAPASPPSTASTTHRTGAAPAARKRSAGGGISPLVLLALIPVVAIAAIVRWLVVRPTRDAAPRSRREVSPAMLRLLAPVVRRDHRRDAWVLRVIGARHGPVLRRRPPVRPTRRSNGNGRWSGAEDGWSYEPEFEEELEREPPPLAIRPRPTKPSPRS